LLKTLSPLNGKYQALVIRLENNVNIEIGAGQSVGDHFIECPLVYGKISLGSMKVHTLEAGVAKELALLSAPVLYPLLLEDELAQKLIRYFDHTLDWINGARRLAPELCDWIGVYFQASHLIPDGPKDSLWVAPYVGEGTEHMDIPVQNGLCGLAFRERRVVNMADVHADPRHIACSLKTRSELILPLYNSRLDMVAELDIDSWTPAAFTSEREEAFLAYAKTFQALE
jgi:putative methionine-R-sulfoxide reductase with GAF domain